MLCTKHAWRDLQNHSCPGLAACLVGVVSLSKAWDACGGPFCLTAFAVVGASPPVAENGRTRSCYKLHIFQAKSTAA